MADSSDVEVALAALAAAAIYPQTPGPPIAGTAVTIGPGLPTKAELEVAIAAGGAYVTAIEVPGYYRETTGYINYSVLTPGPPASVTLTVSGNSVTFSGSTESGLILGVGSGAVTSAYVCTGSETLAEAATALAVQLAAGVLTDDSLNVLTDDSEQPYVTGIPAIVTDANGTPLTTDSGATIAQPASPSDSVTLTLSTPMPVVARTGTTGSVASSSRWQEGIFNLTVWAPSPAIRTALTKAVDAALAAQLWLQFPDGTAGLMRFRGNKTNDQPERARVWVRTLVVSVLYPTTSVAPAPVVVWPLSNLGNS